MQRPESAPLLEPHTERLVPSPVGRPTGLSTFKRPTPPFEVAADFSGELNLNPGFSSSTCVVSVKRQALCQRAPWKIRGYKNARRSLPPRAFVNGPLQFLADVVRIEWRVVTVDDLQELVQLGLMLQHHAVHTHLVLGFPARLYGFLQAPT